MENNHLYAHIDIRNFYGACEQYLNPSYRGKAVVIYNESSRGKQAIIAVSREAKQEKIKRGVPIEKAKRLNDVVLIKSRLEEYERISNDLYHRCADYLGDKAFSISKSHIDDIVIRLPNNLSKAIGLTRKVEELYNKLGFEVTAGISFNEDYAHIATKLSKANRLITSASVESGSELFPITYIGKCFAKNIVYKWPVIEFPGIGSKRKEKLNMAGIETIGDIANSHLNLMIMLLKPTIGSKIYFSVLGFENPKLQLGLFGD